jgi:hypothetical protein
VVEKAAAIGETTTTSVTEIAEKATEIIDDEETFDDFDDFDLAIEEINPSENPQKFPRLNLSQLLKWKLLPLAKR